MSVTAEYNLFLKADEIIALSLDITDDPTLSRKTTTSGTMNASSTVPSTKAWGATQNLSAGAATLDLQALLDGNLPNVDFTGLKVQAIKVECPSTNTSGVAIVDGASNGYNIWGDASGSVTVLPGCSVLMFFNDQLDDVAASDSEIDLSSSDTDATFTMLMVAG